MAAVEGIPDQVIDVNQKHVPRNSNSGKSSEEVLSNGESNETSTKLEDLLESKKEILVSEDGNLEDLSATEDVEMLDSSEHECKEVYMEAVNVKCEEKDETVALDLAEHCHASDTDMDSESNHLSTTVVIHSTDKVETENLNNSTLVNGLENNEQLHDYVAETFAPKRDIKEEQTAVDNKELLDAECLKQENLFKKLGFNPVKNVPVDSISAVTDENINVSNYNSGSEKSDVKEKILAEIVESTSNTSSRCSSPGVVVNGVLMDREGRKSNRVADQNTLVATLKEDLRTEEAKLLLLRKIMDSHSGRKNGSVHLHKTKENTNRHMNVPSLHPKSRLQGQTYSGAQPDGNSSIQIAPKIVMGSKGSPAGPNMPRVVPSIVSSGKTASGLAATSIADSPRVTYPQLHSGVPVTAIMTQPVHKYYIQVGSQLVPAAPPTCINQPVYAMPVYSNSTTSGSTKPKVTSTTMSSMSLPKSSSQPAMSADTQASKHSVAKAALRRQLEQTLLQIPPPRPPSADWRVIPNVNSMDFMMLVGLDEIVDMILECDGKPTLKRILADMLPENPIICDQCGMDFSPLWKQRGVEKQADVLCEKCSLTNTKKELKAEHTSRLKSAFLKALKQEQEIEKKIKAGEDVHIGSPPLQDKDIQGGMSHHKSHVHSVHQPYKHVKDQKNIDHHHQAVHRHHHGVVQHYPHHSSLVHQLHQQHIQQQQVDYDPGTNSSRRNARWHPYAPSHHHSGSSHAHGAQHHRTYNSGSTSSAGRSDGRHEYYVVHHPQQQQQQHSNSATRWGH